MISLSKADATVKKAIYGKKSDLEWGHFQELNLRYV